MTNKLQEYFNIKNEYIKGHSLIDEFKISPVSIFDIKKTNMPVRFYEKNGEFTIEITNHKDPSIVYYRKTLIIKNSIDLSFLYNKYQEFLSSQNVEFTKINYLHRIDDINERRSKIEIIKNSLQEPNNDINISLDEINNELNSLNAEFDQWFSNIKKIIIQMNIIQDIYNEHMNNDRINMNEYTIGYYWLNSKTSKNNDDTHYIMSKLITQSGNIKVGYVLKYASIWHIVTEINGSMLTIQNLRTPFDTKAVNTKDVIYTEGNFHIFKDYKIINNNPELIDEWINKLPNDSANMIVSKLIYQKKTMNKDDIVLYNNTWGIVNSIEDDNILIMNLETNQIDIIPKELVEHPEGYRSKYNKIHLTEQIILPIDKWINSINPTNHNKTKDYINNKELYQKGKIKKGDIVKYNSQWYIIVNIVENNIMIQNLENINDKNVKSVLITEVTHPEGYYHKYKKFKFTDNLVIPKKDWINRLNAYSIATDDIEDIVEERTEYPASNGKPLLSILKDGTEEQKEKRKEKKERQKEDNQNIILNEFNDFKNQYDDIINELNDAGDNISRKLLVKFGKLITYGKGSKNQLIIDFSNTIGMNNIKIYKKKFDEQQEK